MVMYLVVKYKKILFILGLNGHAPIGYHPGVTMNSNILNGNDKEMIVRLIINNFMYNKFRQVVYLVVKQWSNRIKCWNFLSKIDMTLLFKA